jgi:hypothetical protein
MEEAGEEEKGRGALGLGTSSKLLEPSAKGINLILYDYKIDGYAMGFNRHMINRITIGHA